MDKKSLIVGVLAVSVIVAAGARLLLGVREDARPLNSKPFEYLGRALGEETLKVLGGQGSVVLVVETMGGGMSPNTEAQVAGFKAALAKKKGVTLKAVSELARSMTDDPRYWPPQHASQLVGSGAGANAIVYLGGLPESLSPPEMAALKGNKASLIIAGTQTPMVKSLLKDRIIRLAIVNRMPALPPPGGAETTAQWYGRVYEVLRSQ